MLDITKYKAIFEAALKETSIFWSRFKNLPDVRKKIVLDFGSGNGYLALDLARSGAKRVIGIEIDSGMVEFSNNNLQVNFPQFIDQVEYRVSNLTEISDSSIDIIVSKDVLEHVIDLDRAFENLYRILKPGGRFYIGFGPLYYSPFGFHRRLRGFFKIQKIDPLWLHVLLPEPLILGWWNKTKGQNVHSIYDLGLNKVQFGGYMRAIKNAKFKITWMQINSGNRAGKLLYTLFQRIPRMVNYFIYNVFLILEK